jgi:hypothetical protein
MATSATAIAKTVIAQTQVVTLTTAVIVKMLPAAMITNAKMVAIAATNLVTRHAMILAMTSVQKNLKTATAMRNARAESLQTA